MKIHFLDSRCEGLCGVRARSNRSRNASSDTKQLRRPMRYRLTYVLCSVLTLIATVLPANAQGYLFNQLSGFPSGE